MVLALIIFCPLILMVLDGLKFLWVNRTWRGTHPQPPPPAAPSTSDQRRYPSTGFTDTQFTSVKRLGNILVLAVASLLQVMWTLVRTGLTVACGRSSLEQQRLSGLHCESPLCRSSTVPPGCSHKLRRTGFSSTSE